METRFLKIPPPVSRPDIWAQYQPKKTKAWIEELPTANHAKVAQLVDERLSQLKAVEGDALERFEILELMRPTIYELLDHLRCKSVGARFPLNDENAKISELALSIATELATSYWSIAQSLVDTQVSRRLGKKSAIIAQRTLVSLGQILLFHYLYKRVEPKGIWLDIHQIFLTFHKDTKTKVIDKTGRKLPKTSLVDCYKQLLMLRLSEPYSLLHSEIIEVFVSLEKWAGTVNLELFEKAPIPDLPYCLIDYQKDSPAGWARETDQLSPGLGYLDRTALLRLLNDHKEFVNTNVGRYDAVLMKGAQLPLSLGLIEYLEQRWSGQERSVAKIFGNRQSRLFLLGLKSIHQSLNSSGSGDEIVQSEWLAETDSDSKLTCNFFEPERISLGHLTAFRKIEETKHSLALGITSRILNQRDGSIEFDLQLLAGKPQAAGIQPIDISNKIQTYQRAILFFTAETAGRKTWIIVETKQLKRGEQVRLLTSKESVIAGVLRSKNIGNSCYLIECRILKKAD